MDELVGSSEMSVLLLNVQGLMSSSAELCGQLRLMDRRPEILCLNETWLDRSIKDFPIEGYTCVGRRDRTSGKKCGGVATYVINEKAAQVTSLEDSKDAERQWLVVHTNHGPVLIGNWYRPPSEELGTIDSLETELESNGKLAVKKILVGDMNVHHKSWLRYSQRDSPEGRKLRSLMERFGMRQMTSAPTRGENLLDLTFADVEGARSTVLWKVADHNAVLVKVAAGVPATKVQERLVWRYRDADWSGLQDAAASTCWDELRRTSPCEGADWFVRTILELSERFIPRETIQERVSTHEWLTPGILKMIKLKRDAEGTAGERAAAEECSREVLQEYNKYVARSRAKMAKIAHGSKRLWKEARKLALQSAGRENIPALRDAEGQWVRSADGKADLIARTLKAKFKLPENVDNEYTALPVGGAAGAAFHTTPELALEILEGLRSDSGTGPDLLPARILKALACELSTPAW